MAQRRMFSLSVVDTDKFLDMPQSAQALYFHLGMRADDDGFVSSPKKILKATGAANDDLKLLIAKSYIIPFDSGVCVITDWKQNNIIKSDRYKATVYKTEKSLLSADENGSYTTCPLIDTPSGTQLEPVWNQSGTKVEPQVRLGKDSIGKDSIGDILPGAETAPDPQEPPAIEIVLNDGSHCPVYPADIERWSALYPAVDIMAQLRKMAGWADANPQKRKTRSGIRRFINGWLAKEQDRGGAPQSGQAPTDGSSHPDGGVWLNGKQVLGV